MSTEKFRCPAEIRDNPAISVRFMIASMGGAPSPAPEKKKTGKKLSYLDQHEYDLMEENILSAENRQEEL